MMLTVETRSKALTKIMSDEELKRMYTGARPKLRKFMLIAAAASSAEREEIEKMVTDRLGKHNQEV